MTPESNLSTIAYIGLGGNLENTLELLGSARKAIEAVLNHLHIADIQHHGCEDISRERLIYLGRLLAEIYRAKLAWQFPAKQFEVLFDDSPLGNLIDYQITFFQKDAGTWP